MGALIDLALRADAEYQRRHAEPEPPADPAIEARRQRVLAMLAERAGIRYAVVVDDPDADPVRLMLAIRRAAPDGSTVSAELAIPRAKYDAALLLDLIARHGGAVH
jgi:hypothetical protein